MTLGQGLRGDCRSPRGDRENTDGVTLGQGNHHIEPSTTSSSLSPIDPEPDKQKSRSDESTEASSSSSRRLFLGVGLPEIHSETANASNFVDQLVRYYGLSQNQRKVVAQYHESLGEEYIRKKDEIVRAQPRRNAAGALLAALRDDWHPPVATKGQTNGTHKGPVRPLVRSRTFTEERPEIAWDWKGYLLDQGMAPENLPKDLTQLDHGLFERYIVPEHRRRLANPGL